MINANKNTSDIKKVAEQVDSGQIEQNLESGKSVDTPESLTEEEKTPFIDDELRTDK